MNICFCVECRYAIMQMMSLQIHFQLFLQTFGKTMQFEQFTYQVLLEVDERESATVGRHPHKLGSYFFKPSDCCVFQGGAKMLDLQVEVTLFHLNYPPIKAIRQPLSGKSAAVPDFGLFVREIYVFWKTKFNSLWCSPFSLS